MDSILDPPDDEQIVRVKKKSMELLKKYLQLQTTNAEETFFDPSDDPQMVQWKKSIRDYVRKCQLRSIDPEELFKLEPTDTPKVIQLKELYSDLVKRYRLHGTKVQQIWRSFDGNKRLLAMKDILNERALLPMYHQDRTTGGGQACKFVPDLNVHDITHPELDYLLDLLRYRATTSLFKQYCEVDYLVIIRSMRVYNLQHPCAKHFKKCFTQFMNDSMYGKSVDYQDIDAKDYKDFKTTLAEAFDSKQLIPQAEGELILERQLIVFNFLNNAIEDILYYGSTSRSKKKMPEKPERAARATLTKLSIQQPEKLSLPGVLASTIDHKTGLKEYLSLCYSESTLFYATNNWFYSRPEAIPDEKGRVLATSTDKHISSSIFEMIHNSVIATMTWDYLARLLQLLVGDSKTKVARVVILQEISNVCYLEYGRVQTIFKRYVQSGSGRKYFRRNFDIYDDGIARVGLKGNPEYLTRENPQLHYMLRLCATETNASKAITWIKKLDDLHRCHPAERDNIWSRELESFGDLAVTAGFMQSLSDCLPIPSTNLKKGQVFVSKSKDLAAELSLLKTQVDLSNFAVPIHNLMEPGMTEGATGALDQFVTEKTGTTMLNLYENLIEECVSQIQANCRRQKEKIEQNVKISPTLMKPVNKTTTLELRIQQRKQKHKTRPSNSPACESSPESPSLIQYKATQAETPQPETAKMPPSIFKVKKDTFEVLNTLFSKSESRGSITWVEFESAMVDLMFSVIPKFGSVFTFLPPADMEVQKSITFHRPHKSEIEGYTLLIFARRLERTYGWGKGSFVVEAKQQWRMEERVISAALADE